MENIVSFVRIPKNASTTIYQVLGVANTIRDGELTRFFQGNHLRYKGIFAPSHCSYVEAVRELGTVVSDVPSFAVIRNPYDRMVSMFCFAKKHQLFGLYGSGELSFVEFARAICARHEEDPHFFHAFPQSFYIDGVQTLLPFETLVSAFQDFLRANGIMGVSPRLPQLNSTSHGHYSDFYNEECRLLVESVWGEDIERFGYSF